MTNFLWREKEGNRTDVWTNLNEIDEHSHFFCVWVWVCVRKVLCSPWYLNEAGRWLLLDNGDTSSDQMARLCCTCCCWLGFKSAFPLTLETPYFISTLPQWLNLRPWIVDEFILASTDRVGNLENLTPTNRHKHTALFSRILLRRPYSAPPSCIIAQVEAFCNESTKTKARETLYMANISLLATTRRNLIKQGNQNPLDIVSSDLIHVLKTCLR